jgi:uncharacterized membrane protein
LNLIRVMPAKGQDRVGNSTFLARLIGPVALAAGVGLLVNQASYRAMAAEFMRSRALIFLSGLLSLTGGLAIVLTHNVWAADWPVLITIVGWLATLSGVARILIPDKVEQFGRSALRTPRMLMIGGLVWTAIGALLCFFGYFR